MPSIRPAVLAGNWYPAEPGLLRSRILAYLDGAEPSARPTGQPRVAVVPHAGYEYSGPTAGKFYGTLAGCRYAAVFILAPSHRFRLRRATLTSADAFATPLGEVPVAREIVAALAGSSSFEFNDRAHDVEHAIEIQLPFLQCALPAGTPIVPILIPHLDRDLRQHTAAALRPWRDDHHLFLVSSDFTHYGGDYGFVPFTDDIPRRIEQLDTGAILKILAHDGDGLIEYGAATGITMCGLDAAATAITDQAPVGYEAALLGYARSTDAVGDDKRSVSYAAVVLCAAARAATLAPPERAVLLTLAREAVSAAVRNLPAPDPRDGRHALTDGLREPRGAFVTLTGPDGSLRGCIGVIEGRQPLVDAVVANARSAALDDPRFPPVRANELPGLQIEVSALTPLRRAAGLAEIEIGRHGILMVKGRRQAVFLPQVAPAQGWDLPTTLDHLARKAGLAAGDWRNETELHIFEAEVMPEESR
jgi:AmmeMemoRadiSam system protein B/AmmeMemoRadiSam system protein A